MLIQNAEEIFTGYDPAFILCKVILNERLESLFHDPLTQVLQKVCAVEIDSVLVIIIILPIVNGDVYVTFRLKEVNTIGPPPRKHLGI